MGLAVLLLFPVLVWLVPGWVASRWLIPTCRPLERVGTALLLGIIMVAPTAYFVAYSSRSRLTPTLIVAVALAFSGLFEWLRRKRPRAEAAPPLGQPKGQSWWVVVGVVVLAGATALTTSPRAYDSGSLFTPCLHESCLIMLEDGTGGGLEAYDPDLNGVVWHMTARPRSPGYGLGHILGHQRPGSMATMAQGVAFHGSGGLVVMMFLYDLLVALFCALLVAQRVRQPLLVLGVAAVFLLGARSVAVYMVNENILGLGLGLGLLHLAFRTRDLAGAAFLGAGLALTVALRPITLTYLPALLLIVPLQRRVWAGFAGGLAVCAIPWLITNFQNYEFFLYHPSLSVGQHPHTFMGISFTFHPLNWPFSDQLMRAEFEPFPTVFRLPFEHLSAFGVLFWVLAALGMAVVPRRHAVAALAFAAPNYLMLCAIVSLDSEKLSYGLLSFAPMAYLAGAGLNALLGAQPLSWPQRVTAGGLALLWTVLLPNWAANTSLEIDPRSQYHTTGAVRGDDQAAERTRLLTWSWIPDLERFEDAAARLETTGSLVWYGRPPQRNVGEIASGPVMVWLDEDDAEIAFKARLLPGSAAAAMMRKRDQGCQPVRGFAVASFYLEAGTDVVSVVAHQARDTTTLHIETDGGAGLAGYLTLGLHNDQFEDVRHMVVLVDGERLPVRFLVRDWQAPSGEIERYLRVVSNHPWHYVAHKGEPRARPGLAPTGCWEEQYGPMSFGHGDGAMRLGQPHGGCRFWTVSELAATPREPACVFTQLRAPPLPRQR